MQIYLGTITVANTRATYAAALERMVADFGADTDVALLDSEPDRVSGRFTYVWGAKSAKTFNIRLTALGSAERMTPQVGIRCLLIVSVREVQGVESVG
ncbi:hypothetical protein NONO_c37000 [Nocardia nova SH22a]|uniref:Uncharacterized protein n=1 Tax=Nocardia nova SH22a TaxID=1415166 RepID=W5TH16_9NOCA|nr:hypothetical protein NONO_c37000 [Nocardia nova SH22a]